MKKEFLDIEYMRQAVEDEKLNVKTGIQAGFGWPPIGPYYGVPLYGIDPYVDPAE